MTETLPDIDTLEDVLVLESLDFAPRCEHSQHWDPGWRHHHDGPAAYLRSGMCPGCPDRVQDFICQRWHDALVENPSGYLQCTACDGHYPWVDFGFTFIRIPEVR